MFINMNKVTVYSKPNCGGCEMTKAWLKENKVPYNETDITKSPESLEYIKSMGFSSLPIAKIDLKDGVAHVVGYSPTELSNLINQQ